MEIARWIRPYFQPALARSFLYWIVWMPEPGRELSLSRQRHGLPDGSLPEFTVRSINDAEWLSGFLQLGGDHSELRSCLDGVVIRGHFPDSQDMFALQAGLSIVKAYCDAGALAVLDLVGIRWWQPEALLALPPDRPFHLPEHVEVVWERSGDHLCNTRGMAKFARPELFTRNVDADQIESVAAQLWAMAEEMALGRQLRGDHLEAFADDSEEMSPRHGLAPEMFRNASLEWHRPGRDSQPATEA